MRRLCCLLAALAFALVGSAETSGKREAPTYTAASLVNSATGLPGPFAPNGFATIYGTELAFTTRAMVPEDVRGNILPTVLAGTGVRVLVNSQPAVIYYVSPKQVNFLIPSNLLPGPVEVQLTLDGRAGPAVKIDLSESAPGLFPKDEVWLIAAHADGTLITLEAPARRDEVIVIYASGLGPTRPGVIHGQVPAAAAVIVKLADFSVVLGESPVPRENIWYAGVTPGLAGLYQINVKLPDGAGDDPEVRLRLGERESPALRLPLRPE